MLIGSRQRLAELPLEPNICIGSDPIKRVRDTKILGVYIDESLTWSNHIDEIAKTITAGISTLKRLRDFASRDVLVSVYNALIMPHFDYCCEVWDSLGSVLAERLQKHPNLRHASGGNHPSRIPAGHGWQQLVRERPSPSYDPCAALQAEDSRKFHDFVLSRFDVISQVG